MWVKVNKKHDVRLSSAASQSFKPREKPYQVTSETGAALIKAGAAVEVKSGVDAKNGDAK